VACLQHDPEKLARVDEYLAKVGAKSGCQKRVPKAGAKKKRVLLRVLLLNFC
jgi:hypothetical protein